MLRALGTTICIDYTRDDLIEHVRRTVGREVDAVVDLVGGDLLARTLPLIRPYGRAATIVALQGDPDLAIDKNTTLRGILVRPNRRILNALTKLVDGGRLLPIIDLVLPLNEGTA